MTPRAPDPPPGARPRVVVTGIGLVTGLGGDREATWSRLRAGATAFRRLEFEGPGGIPCSGCPVAGPDHRVSSIFARAVVEAVRDARLRDPRIDRDRVATVLGMSKGDPGLLAAIHTGLLAGRPEVVGGRRRPWLAAWPHAIASRASRVHDWRGPCLAPVAACATGLVAALQAAELIRRGVCDVALAGAGDASLTPFLLGAFRRLGVLARVDGDPNRAVRPWDRGRSGFLVGEGAAVLVLEREDHATQRGALSYAELAGGALGADAYHETGLDPDPSGLAGLIGRALEHAEVDRGEVDHVNVHGTATRDNDPLECRALRFAFGAGAGRLACAANKGQIGHLLGAAGAVELAIACLSIRDGFVPPTANLESPDPACDLDGTPRVGRSLPIRAALKLSIGFGGHLAAAVLRRLEGPRRPPGAGDDA